MLRVRVELREKEAERFTSIGFYSMNNAGLMPLPAKHNGQVSGFFIRKGARTLLVHPEMCWVDYQFGTLPAYRIVRVT